MAGPCDDCRAAEGVHLWTARGQGPIRLIHLCPTCFDRRWKASEPALDSTDLQRAEELIASLPPTRLPSLPGFEFGAYFRPSRLPDGAMYDFVDLEANRRGLWLSQPVAPGLAGATIAAQASAHFRREAPGSRSPAEMLRRMNEALYRELKRGTFVTAAYAVLTTDGLLTFVSAGHGPLIWWQRASGSCRLVNPNGIALGIDRGHVFERTLKEETLRLEPGDRFLMLSDGVVESPSPAREEYGLNRLGLRVRDLAPLGSPEFLARLVEDVERHLADGPQAGDFVLLTGRRLP